MIFQDFAAGRVILKIVFVGKPLAVLHIVCLLAKETDLCWGGSVHL